MGSLTRGETCDGNCPKSCVDDNQCILTELVGAPETCGASCMSNAIVECIPDDGCCPDRCNALSDTDCSAECGNQIVEPGETCDGELSVSV